ncbi:MAG: metalloregulator ArsR/SmtB family transcription factor [bacterium]|nr:metalloregulator ArsR/SmtB family transcription factor [bacterium]
MRLKNFSLTYGTQIFKSFSEEPRIRIIHLLYRKKELCISDLEVILDFTQTKTSRHIAYLKNAGLVSSRKKDQWVIYSIKEEVIDFVGQIFEFLNKDSLLEKDLETFDIMESNRELSLSKMQQKAWRS